MWYICVCWKVTHSELITSQAYLSLLISPKFAFAWLRAVDGLLNDGELTYHRQKVQDVCFNMLLNIKFSSKVFYEAFRAILELIYRQCDQKVINKRDK